MKLKVSHQWCKARRGTTLLEVLLATAILSMSLAAIGQLARTGVDAGLRVQHESQAALRCQSLFELLLSGSLPVTEVYRTRIEAAPEWLYSVTIDPAQDGLVQVLIEVEHESGHRVARAEAVQLLHSKGDGGGYDE